MSNKVLKEFILSPCKTVRNMWW